LFKKKRLKTHFVYICIFLVFGKEVLQKGWPCQKGRRRILEETSKIDSRWKTGANCKIWCDCKYNV